MATDEFFSFKVWHPRGLQITLSLSPERVIDVATAQTLFANVDAVLAAGFTVDAPGTEPGQTVEEIGLVSRRQKGDGTPIVDLFIDNDRLIHKIFSLYLDDEQQVHEFEQATGLTLTAIPLWEGDAAMKRDNANARKYIVPTARKAKLVLAPNPLYNPEEPDLKKRKPRHKFVRWELPAPAANIAGTITPTAGNPTTPPASSAAGVSGGSGKSFDEMFPFTLSDQAEVKAVGNGKRIIFRTPDGDVIAYTREPLRGVLPADVIDSMATPGVYKFPAVRVHYKIVTTDDGGQRRDVTKVELGAKSA